MTYMRKALTKFHWFLIGVNAAMALVLGVRVFARHPKVWG